jgi:hypothetical protein
MELKFVRRHKREAKRVILTSTKSKTKEWFDEEGKVVIQVRNEA